MARLRGDLVLTGQRTGSSWSSTADLPTVDVDAGRVGQVLENLVANALKYAPGVTRRVGARVGGAWVEVTIDDDGVGVPEAERALVLEPFHRARNVRESRIPGTGLGLYICRRLVEAHGGRIALARPARRAARDTCRVHAARPS